MGKAISSIMQRMITPVHMDDTLDQVEGILKSHRISSAPVYGDGGAILGIITTTDLIRLHSASKEIRSLKAWEACTYKPLEVSPETPVTKVAELMLEHRVHHVLVLDRASAVGIVSALDFVKLYLDESKD